MFNMELLSQIPEIFLNFLITLAFSLIIGIEQKKRNTDDPENTPAFGTDRSFAFIGTLGFILYILSPENLVLFLGGGAVLGGLLGVFFYKKMTDNKSYGLTSILVALITYTLGALVITQPKWLTVVIVVSVIILVEQKERLSRFSDKINIEEFTTLAKFLVIAAVILPIVPAAPLIPFIELSPYTIWLTVVVVSSISYASYLLQRFVFKDSGVIISGVLGGLYSSTATTLILAKRSKEAAGKSETNKFNNYAASLITATAMMYIRILILMFIFNAALGNMMLPYFIVLAVVSLICAVVVYYMKRPEGAAKHDKDGEYNNPLELKTAALFAGLFVFFSMLTHFVVDSYGGGGLNVLSFVVGFTDIDPFLLNLFQGKYEFSVDVIARASLQAIISSNILKAIYTYIFADKNTRKYAIMGLGVITVVNIVIVILI
jgi:uncharacterized membrane protein (DUF4010 family)